MAPSPTFDSGVWKDTLRCVEPPVLKLICCSAMPSSSDFEFLDAGFYHCSNETWRVHGTDSVPEMGGTKDVMA